MSAGAGRGAAYAVPAEDLFARENAKNVFRFLLDGNLIEAAELLGRLSDHTDEDNGAWAIAYLLGCLVGSGAKAARSAQPPKA